MSTAEDERLDTLRHAAHHIISARRAFLQCKHAAFHGAHPIAIVPIGHRGITDVIEALQLLGVPLMPDELDRFLNRRCFAPVDRLIARNGICGWTDREIRLAAQQLTDELERHLEETGRA